MGRGEECRWNTNELGVGGGRGAPMGWRGNGMALEHEQGRWGEEGGERMGRDEDGKQMGWLGLRGKERGRWNTNRVAVVARGRYGMEGGRWNTDRLVTLEYK